MSKVKTNAKEISEPKILSITVDTDFKDILRFDENGDKLDFQHEVGKFRRLSKDEIKQLSNVGKASYFLSFGMNQHELEIRDNPPTEGLHITGRYASATDRLDVIYPPGWKEKYHPCWKRADEFEKSKREGYTRVGTTGEDKGVISFNPDHTVGTSKETELVLMKEPVEQNEERVGVPRKASTSRIENYEENVKETIREMGGRPYDVPEGAKEDGRNWSSYKNRS